MESCGGVGQLSPATFWILSLFALGRRGRTTDCLATHGSCEVVEALLLSPAACVAEMSPLEFAREELRDLPSSGVWSQPLV
jgi:hypothetical protein